MSQHPICIFGEVLFDIFPGGTRVLGGAPFNVAWHLQAFGMNPLLISRVGDDPMGRQIRQKMVDWGMNTDGLQLDPAHPTGEVDIALTNGEPSYNILTDRAYDHIDGDAIPPVKPQLLYHGSLALRNRVSQQALAQLPKSDDCRVFLDVNLRTPWWRRDEVLERVSHAHWVKLNEYELEELSDGSDKPEKRAIRFLRDYSLQGLVVTCGAGGAFALGEDGRITVITPPPTLTVVDTVGAGDAFASILILGLYHGWPLQQTLMYAQQFASQLVGRRGATVSDPDFYRAFATRWAL